MDPGGAVKIKYFQIPAVHGFDQVRIVLPEAVQGTDMTELSMGMSQDYALAARCGATMVRVGSALFR